MDLIGTKRDKYRIVVIDVYAETSEDKLDIRIRADDVLYLNKYL